MPETTQLTELEDALDLSANYIRRLTVNQLLPPVKQRADADDTPDADGAPVDHFDFNVVLPRLPFLEDFEVTYGVRDCGMNFDWSLFQFTTRDCRLLSECVATCRTLRSLTLHRSKVTSHSRVMPIKNNLHKSHDSHPSVWNICNGTLSAITWAITGRLSSAPPIGVFCILLLHLRNSTCSCPVRNSSAVCGHAVLKE